MAPIISKPIKRAVFMVFSLDILCGVAQFECPAFEIPLNLYIINIDYRARKDVPASQSS